MLLVMLIFELTLIVLVIIGLLIMECIASTCTAMRLIGGIGAGINCV